MTDVKRCFGETLDIYREYHDREWGRPVLDERGLLEKLCLEGFQSGLSWLTILRKRDAFREAFANFDAEAVARFGRADVNRLLADSSIVRHRLKIEAAIANAHATLALREAAGVSSSWSGRTGRRRGPRLVRGRTSSPRRPSRGHSPKSSSVRASASLARRRSTRPWRPAGS